MVLGFEVSVFVFTNEGLGVFLEDSSDKMLIGSLRVPEATRRDATFMLRVRDFRPHGPLVVVPLVCESEVNTGQARDRCLQIPNN